MMRLKKVQGSSYFIHNLEYLTSIEQIQQQTQINDCTLILANVFKIPKAKSKSKVKINITINENQLLTNLYLHLDLEFGLNESRTAQMKLKLFFLNL